MNIYRKIINTKPRYPDGFDKNLQSLVKHLLRRDLSKRYGNLKDGPDDIKKHRFFSDMQWDNLLARKLKAPYEPNPKDFKSKEKVSDWEKEKVKGAVKIKSSDDPFSSW